MLQHPLDTASSATTSDYSDGCSEYPPLTDDDLSGFARRVSAVCHQNDNIVRASSPFGRRYLKPINGIQTKGFAKSAQRRSSVMTLGSIERLQNFYAKRDLKVNKVGTLGFNKILSEEPEDFEESLPTPKEPPPSWIDLDVETDLDVLLSQCFHDIQVTLSTWAMVTGPNLSSSSSQTESESEAEGGSFQILPLIQSATKMLQSVRNYTAHREDLTDEALSKLRHSALDLLESIKGMENQHRLEEEEEEEDGFLYKSSDFKLLEKERRSIHDYLEVVEAHAFNPPHHIGRPPALFTPEIKALMGKTHILGASDDDSEKTDSVSSHSNIPVWLERGSFVDDPLGE
ncbi:hypothetical protein BDB01DRAFT_842218 [Pilobolus umbonatus]|nr:hypothetical protein BDB01DRAFT_842218 [Pilobolus umbonatus]